jgi:SlyX protein
MNQTGGSTEMDGTLDAQRLIELEIKSALADDALDQLSQTLFRQQEQLDALAKEVIRLRDLISRIEADSPRSLRDELPPHY